MKAPASPALFVSPQWIKYRVSKLCRLYNLSRNHLTLLLWDRSNHRQFVIEGVWLCFNKAHSANPCIKLSREEAERKKKSSKSIRRKCWGRKSLPKQNTKIKSHRKLLSLTISKYKTFACKDTLNIVERQSLGESDMHLHSVYVYAPIHTISKP